MSEWWRSWHHAPMDPKWLSIGRKVGVAPGIVAAVVWAMLDHASQNPDRGAVGKFDVETYAAWSGFEENQVEAILKALEQKGVIIGGRFAAWERRQPRREDGSAERAAAWRAAQKEPKEAGEDVAQEDANATERNRTNTTYRTDTEKNKNPPPNPPKGDGVASNATPPKKARRRKTGDPSADEPAFEALWQVYPQRKPRDHKDRARTAWRKLITAGIDPAMLSSAAKRFAAERADQDPRYTPMCATWLNGGMWKPDERVDHTRQPRSDSWQGQPMAMWQAYHDKFRTSGFWPSNFGGPPGTADYRGPPNLFQEHGVAA